MPFVETFAKLDGEPSAPAAGKGFIQTTAPLDSDGPGLMERVGGYLKNAANNVAPTVPDPTADAIMPKRDAALVSDSMGPPSPTKPVTMVENHGVLNFG